MSKIFEFRVLIDYQNTRQVSCSSFDYKYSDFSTKEVIENTLDFQLKEELEDYYSGRGYTASEPYGSYPRGPGGGGLSASSFAIRDLVDGYIRDGYDADVDSYTFEISMKFNELDDNQINSISKDIKYIIETAFNNSSAIRETIYLSPETGIPLNNNPKSTNYDPSGATYSFPKKPVYELIKDEKDDSIHSDPRAYVQRTVANNGGGWIIKYVIKLIEPGKPPVQVAPLIATQSTTQVATQSATQSISDAKIIEDKSYVFNVADIDTLSSFDLGKFILIGEGVVEGFIFQADYESAIISDEYTETEFLGEDEIFVPTLDYVSVNVDELNEAKGFDPNNPDDSLTTDSKYPVSKDKEANIKSMVKVMNERGITNKFTQAAILAVVSKETAFVPRSETTYAKTSAERIKKIFKSFRKYSDSEVDQIKTSAKQFFDIAYGGKFGNGSNEGFLFRGRGFNQLTFRGNYEGIAKKIGIDIVNDPDLLNKVEIASVALSQYFKDRFKSMPKELKSRYNTSGNINDFKTLKDAAAAVYHANAGWGKGYNEILADSTGGRKKTFDRVGALYNNLA